MRDYKEYFIIPVPPAALYTALTNPATIKLWTGEEAVMSVEPGSEFSLWEDAIVGRNISFDTGKQIVQEWYFGDDQPDRSIVTMKMHPHKQGTSFEVRQTNIPDEAYDEIVEGWREVYITSLLDFYGED